MTQLWRLRSSLKAQATRQPTIDYSLPYNTPPNQTPHITYKMDSLGSGNIDISQMSDAEKKDLQQFVVNESQKARIQQCMNCLLSIPPPPTSLPYPFSFTCTFSFPLHPYFCFLRASIADQSHTHSHPLPHRHLFPQMHHRQNLIGKARQKRGALHAKLR